MAKHNLFLGSATSSVGDVTLMRKTGKQVARVRVRTIANPKTEGQAFQRAAMANITKFYAPLAVVLERSWEGKNKAASYSAFIKKNIELARKRNMLAKKGADFQPFPYYISMGTLAPCNAEVDDTHNGIFIDDFEWSENTLGAFSQAFIDRKPGAGNGDQITLLVFCKNDDGYTPVWCRFYLDTTSTAVIDTVLTGFHAFNSAAEGQTPIYSFQVNNPGDGVVAAAMILSHWENGKWRRSPEQLDVVSDIFNLFDDQTYLDECIASFRDSTEANPSDVYLNGEEELPALLSKTAAGAAADLANFSALKVGYDETTGNKYFYVDDADGKHYAFENNLRTSDHYATLLTYNGNGTRSLPDGWGKLPFSSSTAAGDAGAKRNYDWLLASFVPARYLA